MCDEARLAKLSEARPADLTLSVRIIHTNTRTACAATVAHAAPAMPNLNG